MIKGVSMLEQILILLGLEDPTTAVQDKVETIMELTKQRLGLMLGQSVIPEDLNYIVVEVTISRYNRIGSEGTSSHTVQGESLTWSDDDFKPFANDIQAWLDAQEDPNTTRGRVRFI